MCRGPEAHNFDITLLDGRAPPRRYAAVAGAVCILPVATIAVPLGFIALVVGFPLFIPVLIIASLLAAFNSCVVVALFLLSPYGRTKAVEYMRPSIDSVTIPVTCPPSPCSRLSRQSEKFVWSGSKRHEK